MECSVAQSTAEFRKRFLAIARRRGRHGSGSSLQFLETRTALLPVADLRSLIKQTPFVVVGGVATRLYMPERMTLDVDILVLLDDAPALARELSAAGCRKIGSLTVGGDTWELPDGSTLDAIVSDEAWAFEAVHTPVEGPAGLPTIRLPYLALMKLQASRAQDLADITRMLGLADNMALDEVRTAIARYMPDAGEDLESMIALGRMELE